MLLLENALSNAIIKFLAKETKLRIAVAFIGNGASKLINHAATDVKITCNLSMGGTNPNEVQILINRFGQKNVKQIDNLHAKLYIGEKYAIVGSANMSVNGLGTQPKGLREAGYKFKLGQPSGERSVDWFDVLWKDAREITDEDIADAKEKWNSGSPARNGDWKADSLNICDYDFDRPDFPLITWHGNSEYKISKDLKIGKINEECEKIDIDVYNSVEIECSKDITYLAKNRYIVEFQRLINGGTAAKIPDELFTLQSRGDVLENAFHYKGSRNQKSNVMLCDVVKPAIFGLDQSTNYDKFKELINRPEYFDLRDDGYDGCWFDSRIDLMRKFWKELQSNLCGT